MAAMRFEGDVVLITGGASGIGLAAAEQFICEGATVYAADINTQALTDHAARIGSAYVPVKMDVTSNADIDAALELIRSRHGRLDCLINNAAASKPKLVRDLVREEILPQVNANLISPIVLTHAAVPLLEKSAHPSIINVCSISAKIQLATTSVYAATKAGLEAFTRCCAKELPGIRVNAVLPGYTLTNISGVAHDKLEEMVPTARKTPVGRWAQPSEIAAPILFLASSDASFITGTSLIADGGLYASAPIDG